MEILSVRERPEIAKEAIRYFQEKWASDESQALRIYRTQL